MSQEQRGLKVAPSPEVAGRPWTLCDGEGWRMTPPKRTIFRVAGGATLWPRRGIPTRGNSLADRPLLRVSQSFKSERSANSRPYQTSCPCGLKRAGRSALCTRAALTETAPSSIRSALGCHDHQGVSVVSCQWSVVIITLFTSRRSRSGRSLPYRADRKSGTRALAPDIARRAPQRAGGGRAEKSRKSAHGFPENTTVSSDSKPTESQCRLAVPIGSPVAARAWTNSAGSESAKEHRD
jgi:hypothetical protein